MPFKTLRVTDLEKETFDYTTQITDDEIAFIISEPEKTIFVWNGQKASMVQKYKAGTLATKIKSLYHFYGFKTQTVNQGEEIGALREEVESLLQGSGTGAGEEVEAPAKKAPAPVVKKAPTAAKAGSSARASVPAKVATPAKAAPAKAAPAGGADKRVKELQEELENERKKSAQKYGKLTEEMDELKGNLESQIAGLQEELEAVKNQATAATDSEGVISKLKDEKESLQVVIDGLKRELEAKEGAAGEEDIAALKAKNDELASLSEGLEKKSSDLEATISSLQAEITDLKAKGENAAPQETSSEELDELKKRVADLEETMESERKKASEQASEYEDKIKEYEDKIAAVKEESTGKMRELIEEQEASKPVPSPSVPSPAPMPAENLDFASLDELESNSSDKSNLAFVNPYAASEIGGKVDPLTDLKSFLNTVDPSKPIDPELKRLLELLSKQIEDDEEIVKDLVKIKKKVKDKKLDALLDDTIKKIKEKQA
ncbi:MAG TPA: hypothetical protein VKM55_31035 [Candidatus Lokiarchaeia archaeon]|nr:hypothetical protein [Candidatus Lokiarchaeia archaeon]